MVAQATASSIAKVSYKMITLYRKHITNTSITFSMKKVISLLCLTLAVLVCASSCKKRDEPQSVRTSIVGATYSITIMNSETHTPVTLSASFPTSTQYNYVVDQKDELGRTIEMIVTGRYTVASDLISCSAKGVSITYKVNGVLIPATDTDNGNTQVEVGENVFRIGKDYETITLISVDGEEEHLILTLKK